MSTREKKFLLPSLCLQIIFLTAFCSAQDFEANITLAPNAPETVQIKGKILNQKIHESSKSWSFARSPAGVENIGERITNFNLSNEQKQTVAIKKLVPGEYLAEEQAENWILQANLQTPSPQAMAHVSWIREKQGILMLSDLMPQFAFQNNHPISARIKFDLPAGWKIISREEKLGEGEFFVANFEKAIFLIGKNWREKEISVDKNAFGFAISGEWKFSDEEAFQMADAIFAEYKKLFGVIPFENARINLIHFPKAVEFDRWQAETRGANVTILSSDMPFKTLALQRLHEQLRHEIFHLWLPNSLALTGNYAWFYEGFTVYQSLRTGLEMNQIRFEDFLRTLEQAQFIDSRRIRKTSLIETSKNRWNDSSSTVYARGMLVAFLCDAALLKNSNGKRSAADLFRQILKSHAVTSNQAAEGNASVLNVLNNYAELRLIVEKYVNAAEKINWQAGLENTGIEAQESGSAVKFQVKTKLENREKNLLKKLGYNNWRKSLGKSK